MKFLMLSAFVEILRHKCFKFLFNSFSLFYLFTDIGQCVRDVKQEIQISSTSSRFEVSLCIPFLIGYK